MRYLRRLRYADLHCDTLTLPPVTGDVLHKRNAQVTLEKLLLGGAKLQAFALFANALPNRAFVETCLYNFDQMIPTLQSVGITPFLTVENAEFIAAYDMADELIRHGLKICALTWNYENSLGYPHAIKSGQGGLKKRGKTLLEELLQKGVLPDISHLSDDGAADVFSIAKAFQTPVVASHSLCRAIMPHTRNLTDGQIKKIAASGGVVGVNFVRGFIGEKGLFAHVRHLWNVGGEDAVAIGSDFDGTENPLYSGADEMPKFFLDLQKSGFTARQVEKIAYQNAARVLLKE